MAGYTNSFTATDGDLIAAALFQQEYTALNGAFDASGGHKHDGTAGEGGFIPVIADASDLNEILCNTGSSSLDFAVNVASVKTTQLSIVDGAIVPAVTNDVDLGTAVLQFKDIHSAGALTANNITLATGVGVNSILDEDNMASNSVTALATQQSIKAYIDTSFGGYAPTSIASPDGFNVVEIDDLNDKIIVSTDVGSAKTNQLEITATAVYPTTHQGLNLGIDATNEFNNMYVGLLSLNDYEVSLIDNDGTMAGNSSTALVTQSSVVTYVTDAVLDGGSF